MANPFAKSKLFHKVGNITNTPSLRLRPPRGVAVVTTKGRKSGKLRTRAMRGVRDGDRVYATAILGPRADWLANINANAHVTIKLGSKTYRATARRLTDSDELARAKEIYLPVAGWYDYVDYLTYVWGIPTRGNVVRVHDKWFTTGTPVVFELQPE
jgi:deazaflavin-dependent oxidoreductase (nitroreductase family)